MFPYVFLDAVLLVLLNKWSLYIYIHTHLHGPASFPDRTYSTPTVPLYGFSFRFLFSGGLSLQLQLYDCSQLAGLSHYR